MTDQQNSTEKAFSEIKKYKDKYDLLKWVAGLLGGLIIGAFTVGAYFHNMITFVQNQTVPHGMIGFFNSKECPPNWPRADELRGRYVVGIDPNHLDEVGKTIGIALESQENRPAGKHTHGYVNTQPQAGGGRDRMMGGGGGGFQDPSGKTTSGEDMIPNSPPLKDGTPAPYVILSACKAPN